MFDWDLSLSGDTGLYGAFFVGWAFGAFNGALCGWLVTFILMRREDQP